MRRAILAVCAAATVVAGSALPAAAHHPVNVERPFEGSTVSSGTPVVVSVQDHGCGGPLESEPVASVDARLATVDGQKFPDSVEVALRREGACGDSTRWGGVDVDPGSPTAFFGSGAAPMCNGRWRVQARADGGAWAQGASFTVSRGPRPPSGVAVSVSGGDVEVSWARNPETDLAGYRVERRVAGSTSWGRVATVTSTSVVDRDVSPGDWEYRVVALRGDGQGVDACQDTTPDLTAASAVETASVGEPEPSTSPSEGSSTDGGSDGQTSGGDGADGGDGTSGSDGGTSDGSSDAGSGDGDTTDGEAEGADGTADGSGTTGDGSTSGRRVAPPPAATRSGPDTSTPVLPEVAGHGQPRERYYGEDEEYDPALDFGGTPPVEGSETRSGTRTTIAERMVPQAVQDLVARYVDPHRVLRPIAAGLVLVAFAMHLRRWSREQHG